MSKLAKVITVAFTKSCVHSAFYYQNVNIEAIRLGGSLSF